MYEVASLEEIIACHGFDPYVAIEKHINEDIIPKFDCLISCHRSNHDEEGNPAIEFNTSKGNVSVYKVVHIP